MKVGTARTGQPPRDSAEARAFWRAAGMIVLFNGVLVGWVLSHVARWWGDSQSTSYIWPFAAAFGGVAQFIAGMWAYKARDAIATAMHDVGLVLGRLGHPGVPVRHRDAHRTQGPLP